MGGTIGYQSITPVSNGRTESATSIFSLAPAYNFYMQDSMLTPFIEGLVGFAIQTSGSKSASGFSYGGRAGLKVNVTGKRLLTMDVLYLMITEKSSNVVNRYGTKELGVNVGFTVWFN